MSAIPAQVEDQRRGDRLSVPGGKPVFQALRSPSNEVIWTYSGVRPLYDDGASEAQAATRDYVFDLDEAGAPMLSIFGGKITTYRRLAQYALDKLGRHLPAIDARAALLVRAQAAAGRRLSRAGLRCPGQRRSAANFPGSDP